MGYEDIQEYKRSFQYYEQGNNLNRGRTTYDPKAIEALTDRLINYFNPSIFDNRNKSGHPSSEPIFIVGLPRSGSTLVEQILASHSEVEGTMELPNIMNIARKLGNSSKENTAYPEIISSLNRTDLINLGKTFIEETKFIRTDQPIFIDKMPNNFSHIGLIKLILPKAKIIDARRYPLDCCFSMFKQLFAQGQEFSYGLAESGSYYNSYVKLMDHWDKVLPNKILRVNNEDVIEDLEGQVNRLLNFLDLPFEEECISFHETDRLVRTASSEQVRQPINKKGMGRWKPYAKNLKPLIEVLDKDLLKPEDITLISS